MRFSLQSLFAVVTTAAVGLGGLCLARNEGRLIKTGKPLDLAIMGEGYFQIELENCPRTLYTRNGNFHLDACGELVAGTAAERRLLSPRVTVPSGAIPVLTPQGDTHCHFVGQPEGMMSMGQIQLATFPNPQGLKQVADDLYEATNESGVPTAGEPGSMNLGLLRPGYLERDPSENWFAEVKPLYVLLFGFAVTGGCLLLRELRAQRRELTRLQSMLMAR